MSIEKVKAFFAARGMEDRVREFSESSATVELAAKAVGTEPQRIAKSLAFAADSGARLIVVAGDTKIDNRKYKERFGAKAKMLSPEETARLTGHAVGGVCPFALNEGVEVYLDESLKRFSTIFPACGSANSAIELSVDELEDCSGFAAWVDVGKGWRYDRHEGRTS